MRKVRRAAVRWDDDVEMVILEKLIRREHLTRESPIVQGMPQVGAIK